VSLLETAGINLLNFGMQKKLAAIKAQASNRIALMRNIPSSGVPTEGTQADVKRSVREMLSTLVDRSRLIITCGGGMPPYAPTENI
jgi:uroporphyrinogen decarboxylase